jgi:hypothetical protein
MTWLDEDGPMVRSINPLISLGKVVVNAPYTKLIAGRSKLRG